MDLNGDSFPDVLSGSYAPKGGGEANGHFQVLWGTKDGTFRKAEVLKGSDGKPLIISPPENARADFELRACTRPTAVDWDGDGKLDIVSGNLGGAFALFRGEGDGKFSPTSQILTAEGKSLTVPGGHSDPFFVDWDGDGDMDLLSGSRNGGAFLAENTASKGKPIALRPFVTLVEPLKNHLKEHWEDADPKPANSTRVFAADINGDGKMDLLLGDNVILQSTVNGLSKEEAIKKMEQWSKTQKELDSSYPTLQTQEEKDALSEKLRAHWRSRNAILKARSAGRVWLFLRK